MKHRLTLAFFLFFCIFCINAQVSCPLSDARIEQARQGWGKGKTNINYNCRSDSADILHYAIELEMMNSSRTYLRGSCGIRFVPLVEGLQKLSFDLILKVDSVLLAGQPLAFTIKNEQVEIQFPSALVRDQTYELRVFYQGIPPVGDWNGFYFSKDFIYNTGSSFDANPLNYGRAWHPCFESFRERATYSFLLKTRSPQIAQANGFLVKRETRRDTILSYWQLDNSIPSYLAAFAVANFVVQRDTFQGIERPIPIELAAVASDTAALRRGFRHLHDAIATMEKWFGAYAWNKVGYSVVPELSGAMEHATNTAFSRDLLNAAAVAEEFMIHELAHSWFGNQITCESGEDMWINEGLASYSEALFWEYTYGRKRMQRTLDEWAEAVLPYNTRDTFFPPLSGAIHGYTYDSKYIYNRGALVGHSLRGYLGDAAFANGMTALMQQFRYQPINSLQFRDALAKATNTDLTGFFDDWVFSGGYLDVVADSFLYQQEKTRVWLRQRLLGREKSYQNIPVELSFIGDNGLMFNYIAQLNSTDTVLDIALPFQPRLLIIDKNEKLFLAQRRFYAEADSLLQAAAPPFINNLKMTASGAFFINCNYHYTTPEGAKPSDTRISSYGYWDLQWLATNANASARFEFSSASQSDLFERKSKLKPVLLYRPHAAAAWQEWEAYKVVFNSRDKFFGAFDAKNLRAGQYAVGAR